MKKIKEQMPLKGHKQAQIFEIGLNSTPKGKVLRFVREIFKDFNKNTNRYPRVFIVTPNPEIILMTQIDQNLSEILNSADFAVPDGVGLSQAAKFLELPNPKNKLFRFFSLIFQGLVVGLSTFVNKKWLYKPLNTIKGRELFMDLVRLANKKSWRIYLLGGRDGVAEKTAEVLLKNLKKVKIKYSSGPELTNSANPIDKSNIKVEKDIIDQINEFRPHFLFVAFGPGKQEKWLYKWLPKLNIGAGMVVGGTFDYVSGKTKLPPSWMANSGLEWVWRLITQPFYYPKRIKRVFTAFPVFPLKVFWYKFNLK